MEHHAVIDPGCISGDNDYLVLLCVETQMNASSDVRAADWHILVFDCALDRARISLRTRKILSRVT